MYAVASDPACRGELPYTGLCVCGFGRQTEWQVLHMAYGRGQYGGPNWHPNNYAHCAWGYQLYALVKYTLALQDMK